MRPFRTPGAIAQLGERLDRTQEVGGSSPPSSIGRGQLDNGFGCYRTYCRSEPREPAAGDDVATPPKPVLAKGRETTAYPG